MGVGNGPFVIRASSFFRHSSLVLRHSVSMFNIRLSFDSPGWLALLALLPVLWWFSFRSLAALGNVRRIAAIALRSVVLILVILALAELQWKRITDRLTVIYLIDESLSIPEPLKPVMVNYVRQ